MPVYNAAETLVQTLESIAGQSFEDFEVVAVDDGSEDGSGEILQGWVEKDCRFRVLLEEHRGIVETPNRGLGECRGEFVARMAADDKMHPQRLDKQVGMLDADEGLSVVSCLVETFPRENVGQGMIIYEEWLNGLVEGEDILRNFFIESPIANSSAMMRRRVSVLRRCRRYCTTGANTGSGRRIRIAAIRWRISSGLRCIICARGRLHKETGLLFGARARRGGVSPSIWSAAGVRRRFLSISRPRRSAAPCAVSR